MMQGKDVLNQMCKPGIIGMIDASATRRFFTPRTLTKNWTQLVQKNETSKSIEAYLSESSTTARGSSIGPILHVPTGWYIVVASCYYYPTRQNCQQTNLLNKERRFTLLTNSLISSSVCTFFPGASSSPLYLSNAGCACMRLANLVYVVTQHRV